MRKLTLLALLGPVLLTAAPVHRSLGEGGPQSVPPPAPQTPSASQRPKRPGVSTPGVRIPITKLKPEAVYDVPGAPDWMAVDKEVWVSNSPKNSVSRLDPKTSAVMATITVGKHPCSRGGGDHRRAARVVVVPSAGASRAAGGEERRVAEDRRG